MKIIFVVACDLARDPNGYIVVGPETKIACDRAVEIVKSSTESIIAATAGETKTIDGNVYMAHVMRNYLRSKAPDNIHVVIRRAQVFNTSGEMEALAKLIVDFDNIDTEITQITLAVKWWHAPRSWCLCKYWLWKNRLKIPVKISWCHSTMNWMVIPEIGAIIKNACRILIFGR